MSMKKYTAVIIEPRCHKALRFVLENFFTNLNDEWSFIIFHGTENEDFCKNVVQEINNIQHRAVKFVNLHEKNLEEDHYNLLFKNLLFYSHIETEMFLVFQTDSMILNKDQINEFLQYDYVGAPWKASGWVGNGGLSLRRKSKMIEIIHAKSSAKQYNCNEDMYFCHTQHNVPMSVPSFEEAKRFSVETVFYKSPFGIHNTWRYLTPEELDALTTKYPGILQLMELQKVEDI
jgi:hypothetical protein